MKPRIRMCLQAAGVRGGDFGTLWHLVPFSLLAAVLLTLAVLAPTAQAAVTHEFLPAPTAAFSGGVPASASVPGPLSPVNALTIDEGHLWVAERLEKEGSEVSRVDEFDASSGAFEAQLPQVPTLHGLETGVAVGDGAPETQVYVGAGDEKGGGVVAVFGAPGGLLGSPWTGADTPAKSFTRGEFEGSVENVGELKGVAVDGSKGVAGDWAAGDVFVATISDHEALPQFNVVDVFKPEAAGKEKYVTQLTGVCASPPCVGGSVPFRAPLGVAVDPLNGDVLVVDVGGSSGGEQQEPVIDVFAPGGLGQYTFVRQIKGTTSGPFKHLDRVAVDGGKGLGEGEIYAIDQGGQVFQFSPEGAYLGRLTGPESGRPFTGLRGVAVDPASHDLYVGNIEAGAGAVDVFGPDLVIPDATSEAASPVAPLSATLNGTVGLAKEGPATCQFVWGTTKEFGHTASCEPPRVTVESAAVHANLSGLQPDTTYFYRLQATNKNGTNPGEESEDQEFTTPGPGLGAASVSNVSATSATLEGSVNPHGNQTSYLFQYGTTTAYAGGDVPASPGIPVGSGEGPVEGESQHLQGLAADTLYHYRLVAFSEVHPGSVTVFEGPDQTFVTQQALSTDGPPDSPEREQVSPPNKHGGVLEGISAADVVQASRSGSAVTYRSNEPANETDVKGYYEAVQILATRGTGAWSSQDLALPHASAVGAPVEHGGEYRFFSEDLAEGLAEPVGEYVSLSPEAFPADTERTPYVRHDATCEAQPGTCFEPLLTAAAGYADVPGGTHFGRNFGSGLGSTRGFVSANDNLDNVVFESNVALTATPLGSAAVGFYEWSKSRAPTQRISLVNVLPESEGGGPAEAQLGEVNGSGFHNGNARNAISADGSRVFWTDVDNQHLYMRNTVTEKTLLIDGPAGVASPAGEVRPKFQLANAAGTEVFFTDSQQLTVGSGAGGAGFESSRDLYECDIVEEGEALRCNLSDLTPPLGRQRADVQGFVLGASSDGNYMYFVATGALSATPNARGESPAPGAPNLYLLHRGASGAWEAPQFVAALSSEDVDDWGGGESVLHSETARVSSNGRYAVFMSAKSLTGYDNRDVVSDHPDEEVYLFDASTGSLTCVSCDPSGGRPAGREYKELEGTHVGGFLVWQPGTWLASSVPGWTQYEGHSGARYQSRYLSDEGRVFFNSNDALVPQDVNGQEDVYEYDPAGVADCSSASVTFSAKASGCVSLVSSGRGPDESAFVDASESGDDVFYLTAEQEASTDTDSSYDLYDAHVCTAQVPCLAAQSGAPACTTAEACRAAPSPQPSVFGLPSSATLSGGGNAAGGGSAVVKPVVKRKAVKCKRGFVKNKKSRCVRVKHKKKAKRANTNRRTGR